MKHTFHQLPLCLTLLMAHNVMHPEVINITSQQEFDTQTANSPAVVKFFATWCGPCQASKQPFLELSNEPEFKNIKFLEVDVDASAPVAQKYGVSSMPTFIYFQNGEKKELAVGFKGKPAMRDGIKQHFSTAIASQPTAATTTPATETTKDSAPAAAPAETQAAQTTETAGIWQSIKDTASNAWNKIASIF